jgi:hypothetical protein
MTRAARYAYATLAVAFLVGVIVQVFVIGLALFSSPSNIETHRSLGWILHLIPILILALAALSRAGRGHWQWALALALVVFVVPILATQSDALGALHPVGALVTFWLALRVARNAISAIRMPDVAVEAVPEPAAG